MEQTEMEVIEAHDPEAEWEGGGFWFSCPGCGDRVHTAWYLREESVCDTCGARISVRAVVRYEQTESSSVDMDSLHEIAEETTDE